ncbi:MAG: hypothetical protein A2Y38_17445 [Spirochaetes bacterium GWB1_59_5]|nr:MAG: hypothetical protein A2Y38_17445 [Spirochaetes bacterium GWB1_59_5]
MVGEGAGTHRVLVGRVYKHHKGGLYTVVSVALESTNSRQRLPVVVYVSLSRGFINVRDLSEWEEVIRWSDGYDRPRFVLAD